MSIDTSDLVLATTNDPQDGPRRSFVYRILTIPEFPVGGTLVALIVAFSILRPSQFATTTNLQNILADSSMVLIMSIGMTYVIVAAGIDLSVGSVLVFSSVVSAQVMQSMGGTAVGTVVVGLGVAVSAGLAWGFVNGMLVAKLRLSPLIVTLATLGAALGFAQIITSGVDLRHVPLNLINSIGNGRVYGVSWLTVIAVGVSIVGGLVLHFTRFGRHTYVIGSNPTAARDAGINVVRHLIRVYCLMGALAGLAGFLSLARFGTTEIGGHSTDNLQVITAVILGGTSLFGGSGSVTGTVIGAFIPAVMLSGFVIVGVQSFWQEVAVGAILIIAVLVDRIRRRQRE